MAEIRATSAAKAPEPVQQAKPVAKPAAETPRLEPKRDRVEVSDEAKAKLAAEEQQRTSAKQQAVVRTQGEQNARNDAAIEALGLT